MAGSGVDRRAPVTKGRACGYLFLPEGGIVNAEHTDTADAPGAGGLSSTAEDMGRWASALLAGRIVSRETLERATTPVTLPGGRLGAYGQGFMTVPFRGLQEFGHGGDISGFNSYVAFYPDEGLGVIVLSNVGMRPPGPVPTAGDVAHRIVAGLVGGRLGPEWPPVVALAPETLARYAGRYRIVAPPPIQAVMGETIDFTVEGGRLFASAKQGRVEVFAESETSFFGKDSPARITFLPAGPGLTLGVPLATHSTGGSSFSILRPIPRPCA
jgi:CubicO group peptidase (beta-lactamase class C family)